MDANYLHFFVLEAPMLLLFTHHFPSVRSAVLELAAQNKPTLQSILAVSAQHADMLAGRKPTRALIHLSKCLPEIQNALTTLDINEGHITAVYGLTRVYYARRERATARKHLHGLYLMLESYQHGPLDNSPDSMSSPRSPRRPSPLMMFLWRVAIQMDIASGSRGQALVFPPTTQNQDDFHRVWISRIASQDSTEWALAEFALDDLHHRTLHLEKHAIRIRSSPQYDPVPDEEQIRLGVEKLWCLHHVWKTRNVVCQAERIEDMALQQWSSDDTPIFLMYGPPLKFKNEYFARMLMYHTERIIQIDLIELPNLERPSERRIKAAIELCRIIAGVGKLFGGTGIGQYFHALNNAGMVFNPHIYPDGNLTRSTDV
jgi:hypothetical protein